MELTVAELEIYCALDDFEWIWSSDLAEKSGIEGDHYFEAVKSLKDKGLIRFKDKSGDDARIKSKVLERARILAKRNEFVDFTMPSVYSERGNAYYIMGAWEREAKSAGWDHDNTDEILEFAQLSDYEHLRKVISSTCK